MSTIVGRQTQSHECDGIGGYAGRGPGGPLFYSTFGSGLEWLPEGTIVECSGCGKTWVASYLPGSGSMTAFYRREKRREKRKRECQWPTTK